MQGQIAATKQVVATATGGDYVAPVFSCLSISGPCGLNEPENWVTYPTLLEPLFKFMDQKPF